MSGYARWPDNLPLPLLKGYGYAPSSNLLQSDLDSGEMRVRRRFKNMPSKVTINVLLNEEQAALYEGWFLNVIYEGAAWFIMPIKTPAGVIDHVVRFKLPHKAMKPITHKLWRKVIILEVKERAVIGADDTEFLTGYVLTDAEKAALKAQEIL
ncbi:MAG: hypothetical protein RPR28_11585 [Cycloclasticus sp.]|jgi:hypothetical protein